MLHFLSTSIPYANITRHSFSSAARSLSRHTQPPNAEQKAIDTALRILDLVAAEPIGAHRSTDGAHSRLIQSCISDALTPPRIDPTCSDLSIKSFFEEKVQSLHLETSFEHDPLALFHELHRRGSSLDVTTASGVTSLCSLNADLITGLQVQSLSLKTGIGVSTAVASSLVGLYSKCGSLSDAWKMFEEMRMRSTVLYTSIIAAFAQGLEVGSCLFLLNEMRRSGFDPNDYTISSVLSVCTGTGCVGIGRSVHGFGVRAGFGSYLHVCNALISMYAKCGSIKEAAYVFERMECKDLISWNALISGLAQYGLAERALSLFKEMVKTINPDAITFLGVLSSCRHAGFVEQGYQCFQSMANHGVQPGLDHYSCIVDLLGRAGLLEQALDFIKMMPIPPNAVIWGSLLSASKMQGNVRMGILAAQNRLLLEPGCAATHVQLANMYAAVGWWSGVADVRKLMKERGFKTSTGFSWIEVGCKVYSFKAEGKSESSAKEEVHVLESLDENMKGVGIDPEAALWMQPYLFN